MPLWQFRYWSGWLRLFAGQPDLAIRHFETSMRLNPRDQRGFRLAGIGSGHFINHRFGDALAVLRISLEEVPAFTPAYRILAACYAHMGRLEEPRSTLKRLVALTPVVVPTADPFRASGWRSAPQNDHCPPSTRRACRREFVRYAIEPVIHR